MSTVHTIETTTHGRFLVHAPDGEAAAGPAPAGPPPVLVGFHGYGENAEIHLDRLRAIAGARHWLVVSVQALSRFYTRGEADIVGSWMTRQDRDLAIADNIAYVSSVVTRVRQAHATADTLVYAGFSQGVAMAYRAAAFVSARASGLIVLAGDLPPDVVPVASTLPPILLGRGAGDTWYTEARAKADLDHLAAAGRLVEEYVFDEGHMWHASFSERAGRFLDAVVNADAVPARGA